MFKRLAYKNSNMLYSKQEKSIWLMHLPEEQP